MLFSKILHTVICFNVLSRQMLQKTFKQCNEKGSANSLFVSIAYYLQAKNIP